MSTSASLPESACTQAVSTGRTAAVAGVAISCLAMISTVMFIYLCTLDIGKGEKDTREKMKANLELQKTFFEYGGYIAFAASFALAVCNFYIYRKVFAVVKQ